MLFRSLRENDSSSLVNRVIAGRGTNWTASRVAEENSCGASGVVSVGRVTSEEILAVALVLLVLLLS